MEKVENKIMFYMVQNTPLNQKYHNYELGDKFKTNAKHNPKRIEYRKALFKIRKSKRDKHKLFIERLHEKIRKSINKNLPSRQSSIVVFENVDECKALAKKWARFNINPLKVYKVSLNGIVHKCSCTPDDKKENVSKIQHIKGITTYWKGEEETGLYEWLFQGNVEIKEILNLEN